MVVGVKSKEIRVEFEVVEIEAGLEEVEVEREREREKEERDWLGSMAIFLYKLLKNEMLF